jgi:hypothetical protein
VTLNVLTTDGIVFKRKKWFSRLKAKFSYTMTERSRYWRKPPREWPDTIQLKPPSASDKRLA